MAFDYYMYVYMRAKNKTNSSQTGSLDSSAVSSNLWDLKMNSNETPIGHSKFLQYSPNICSEVKPSHEGKADVYSNSDVIKITQENTALLLVKQGGLDVSGLSKLEFIKLKGREMMKHVTRNIFLTVVIATLGLSTVSAQGTPKLDLNVTDQKINLTDAEIKNPSIINYLPGDTIRYTITASNVGDGLMTEPEIVDPIPAGVTYVEASAAGNNSEISYSMNQGKSYSPWPLTYTVRNSKGILVKRKAAPEMITHIKWNITKNLNPGKATTMEFLVVVNK